MLRFFKGQNLPIDSPNIHRLFFSKAAYGLIIQGKGQLNLFPKSLGGQGFQDKLQGCPPILGLIAFLLRNLSKICLGEGAVSSPLVCIYVFQSTLGRSKKSSSTKNNFGKIIRFSDLSKVITVTSNWIFSLVECTASLFTPKFIHKC